MDSPASLGYRNRKIRLNRLVFEPSTSCVVGGMFYHLAIDMSCERKGGGEGIGECGDSMKMDHMNLIKT